MISTTKLKQQLEQVLVDSQDTHYETYRVCGFEHRGNKYKVYNGEKLANKIKGMINMLEVIGE